MLQKNLHVIDEAISESRAALRAEPQSPAARDSLFDALRRKVALLQDNHSVIVDAVHAKREERDAVAEIAARAGAAFTGIWLDAPAGTMRGRIAARMGDVSDATPAVLDEQLGYELGQQNFAVVDAGRPLPDVVASSLELIMPAKL
jgi:predicted kinase